MKIDLDSDNSERFGKIAAGENMSVAGLVNYLLRNISVVKRETMVEMRKEQPAPDKPLMVQRRTNWVKDY